jgi:hypothetical protein
MRPTARERGYTTRWDKARAGFLRSHPSCAFCARRGVHTQATVVDHIVPHRGDMRVFWDHANWQPLCAPCHNGAKRSYEATGRIRGCDEDGNPIDPRHWWNGGVRTVTVGSIPAGLAPSVLPLTIVCGPPASGKTTYVREQAGVGDVVIDLDEIRSRLSGLPWYAADERWLQPALEERNKLLRALGNADDPRTRAAHAAQARAWFLVGAPNAGDRRVWRSQLRPAHVVVLETPGHVCAQRIDADQRRAAVAEEQKRAVRDWWASYQRGDGEVAVVPKVEAVG